MTQQIQKYQIPIKLGQHVLELPETWQRLGDVRLFEGKITLWCLCYPDHSKTKVRFEVMYTGDKVYPSEYKQHMGTIINEETGYVYHVFEI